MIKVSCFTLNLLILNPSAHSIYAKTRNFKTDSGGHKTHHRHESVVYTTHVEHYEYHESSKPEKSEIKEYREYYENTKPEYGERKERKEHHEKCYPVNCVPKKCPENEKWSPKTCRCEPVCVEIECPGKK